MVMSNRIFGLGAVVVVVAGVRGAGGAAPQGTRSGHLDISQVD